MRTATGHTNSVLHPDDADRTNTAVINTFKSLAVTQTFTASPDLKEGMTLGTVPAPPTVQVIVPAGDAGQSRPFHVT